MIMVNGDGLEHNLQLKKTKSSFQVSILDGNNFASSKSLRLFCLIIFCITSTY